MQIKNKPDFIECKICFKQFRFLNYSHLWYKHRITAHDYIRRFKIPNGGTASKSVSERMSADMKRIKPKLLPPMTSERAKEISPLFKMTISQKKRFCTRASLIGMDANLKHWYSKTPEQRKKQAILANKIRQKKYHIGKYGSGLDT